MTWMRAATAVLAGMMLLNFIDATLERLLVAALAQAAPADEAAYLAVRDRPLVLGITLATHSLAALLTGYLVGKIAGTHEVRVAIVAGLAITAAYAAAFASGGNPLLPPVWVRVVLLIVTVPALVAGAYVRREARVAALEGTAGASRPKELS